MSDFRCSRAALARPDQMIGSATHVRAFLLVEHPGPWGQSALRDTALPGNLLAGLRRRASSTGIRILLVRRHRQRGQDGVRVFAVRTSPRAPSIETTVVDTHHDVLDLDLESLGEGRSPGLDPHPDPVFCVCTQGRHDACCAEQGRPVAAALSAAYPDLVWEVSHVGGDRFAGNLIAMPQGLGYGWQTPETALGVVAGHLDGRISPESLRGCAGYPMPVQVAEHAVRVALGEWGIGALQLVSRSRSGDDLRARFAAGGASYDVTVTRSLSEDTHRLTCSAQRDSPVPSYDAGPVTRVADSS